ncbi:hypothetical protein OXB_3017 [Bacillus sp. OxB-1]|uniref:hypothetical protein n=1 Tax=Bacillus sp. (strain OxB-1) TaxID=98228 RepID=UPI0005821E84|nr:hypothetical protein [Bacillus sp. OxB-1]BAQ11487.1 hypothetical protein OXB_3017 [Bacillus sp. OxB-1]
MEKEMQERLIDYLLNATCSKIASDLGVSNNHARRLKEDAKRARAGEKEKLEGPARMAKLIAFYLTELHQSSFE